MNYCVVFTNLIVVIVRDVIHVMVMVMDVVTSTSSGVRTSTICNKILNKYIGTNGMSQCNQISKKLK